MICLVFPNHFISIYFFFSLLIIYTFDFMIDSLVSLSRTIVLLLHDLTFCP
jgi:hypothetical protein